MNLYLNKIKVDKIDIKKSLGENLSNYFKERGFMMYVGPTYIFVKDEEKKVTHFFFHFHSNATIGIGPISITFDEIEENILNIGVPSNKYEEQKKRKKNHLPTIEFRSIPSIFDYRLFESKKVEDFAKSFIEFYERDVIGFIEKYQSIPDIYKTLVELDNEDKNWKELLYGMGDAYIRGLIIYKLCNAPNYNEKLKKYDSLFSASDEWLSYWEKYKEVLENIEPKYNIIDS